MVALPVKVQAGLPASTCPCSVERASTRVRVQVAILLNGVTHLLAGTRSCWPALDGLHAAALSRLQQEAESGLVLGEVSAVFGSSVNALLAFRPSTSESARLYYAMQAARHAAPLGCGVLFVAASAAHCAGSCTAAHVELMQIAARPYADTFSQPDLDRLLRQVAASLVSDPEGPGSGAIGCKCRTVLATNIAGATHWPAALLGRTRTAAPVALTSRVVQMDGRFVFAQVCGAGADEETPFTVAGLRLQALPGHVRVLELFCEEPSARKRVVLGCARQCTHTLAMLVTAAELWVRGGADWTSIVNQHTEPGSDRLVLEMPEVDTCPSEDTSLVQDMGPVENVEWQCEPSELGYEDPHTNNLFFFVYAVVQYIAKSSTA